MNAAEPFFRLVRTRRSIRRFSDEPVERQVTRRLLEAACRAPSAHNRQPWRFAVLRQGEARQRMLRAMEERYQRELRSDGLPESEVVSRIDRSRSRFETASVVIILCLTMENMDTYPDRRRRSLERTMAIQSLALAGGHLLLAAHAEGLGACWLCAPLFAPEEVRSSLGLPETWEPQGAIILGHPGEPGLDQGRLAVDQVTRFI